MLPVNSTQALNSKLPCLYLGLNSAASYKEKIVTNIVKTAGISFIAMLIGLGAGLLVSSSAQNNGKVYELRIYTATPGNLENLHARFRDHTTRIFANHGMKNVGYWAPTGEEERDSKLIYILEHASQAAADASWAAFGQDPEWQAVATASNANGQILAGVERHYMTATDYSPMQ